MVIRSEVMQPKHRETMGMEAAALTGWLAGIRCVLERTSSEDTRPPDSVGLMTLLTFNPRHYTRLS